MRRLAAIFAIAVVLVLSGPSSAAADPPLITGVQIADDSVTGADVLETSLTQVPYAKNADALNGIELINADAVLSFAANGVAGSHVDCPDGKLVVGGGASSAETTLALTSSLPLGDGGGPLGGGWQAVFLNLTADPIQASIHTFAICMWVAV